MLFQSRKTVLLNLILISFVEKVDTLKEIIISQSNKATKNADISTKLIGDNEDIIPHRN